jgi:hypothetical protein
MVDHDEDIGIFAFYVITMAKMINF